MDDGKANEWPPKKLRAFGVERFSRAHGARGVGWYEGTYFRDEGVVFQGEGAQIGERCVLWGGTALLGAVRIGEDVSIGRNCTIEEGSVIGNRVRIQAGVSVYGGVILEDDSFIGPHVVFSNIRNPRPGVTQRDYETTLIRRGAMLGAGSMIRCGAVVGKNAVVGLGSVVLGGGSKDVPAHGLAYGNPACTRGWVCLCGVDLMRIPMCGCREGWTLEEVGELFPGWSCEKCGEQAGFSDADVVYPGSHAEARTIFPCALCGKRYEPDGERGLRIIP